MILAGLWLVLWIAGWWMLVAHSGGTGGDPVLADWIEFPIAQGLSVGAVISDANLFKVGTVLPSRGLLVLFDVNRIEAVSATATFTNLRIVVVPAWLPLVILFGLACLFLIRWGKPTSNTCSTCGYDLTGNVSGRCPEWAGPSSIAKRRVDSELPRTFATIRASRHQIRARARSTPPTAP